MCLWSDYTSRGVDACFKIRRVLVSRTRALYIRDIDPACYTKENAVSITLLILHVEQAVTKSFTLACGRSPCKGCDHNTAIVFTFAVV